jgi:hypothetical protein
MNRISRRTVPVVPASNAVVAQLVEQLIRNQQVSGSNPLNGSSKKPNRSHCPQWLYLFLDAALPLLRKGIRAVSIESGFGPIECDRSR